MSTITPTRTVDALSRALEASDARALVDLYADDAQVRLVDRRNTPRTPLVLSGRAAIAAHYADGTGVLCATLAELRDGKIVRQTVVQAWDE